MKNSSIWNGHGKEEKDMNATEGICYTISLFVFTVIYISGIAIFIWVIYKLLNGGF